MKPDRKSELTPKPRFPPAAGQRETFRQTDGNTRTRLSTRLSALLKFHLERLNQSDRTVNGVRWRWLRRDSVHRQ